MARKPAARPQHDPGRPDLPGSEGFIEVETSILTRSPPRRPRLLGPSRVCGGEWFALAPVTPTVQAAADGGGLERYYQVSPASATKRPAPPIASRSSPSSNRGELSGAEEILDLNERLPDRRDLEDSEGIELPLPFPASPWQEAMIATATDRPDTPTAWTGPDVSTIARTPGFKCSPRRAAVGP